MNMNAKDHSLFMRPCKKNEKNPIYQKSRDGKLPLPEESLWLSGRASERKSEGLRFDSSWGLRIFLCPTLVTRRKNIFLNPIYQFKRLNFHFFLQQTECFRYE